MYSRRDLARALGALPFIPKLRAQPGALDLDHRLLGRTGRWVVPLGLGGQASLQWTGAGIDPADIIVRAVELGVNYLDTANAYGTSQANYGEAFRRLHLAPADSEYRADLRERIYVASKTTSRTASGAIGDLRRSLTTLFGDGRGWIPEGAYLDAMQVHNLQSMSEVEQIYEGMETRGGTMPERIGTLAAFLDYRDGTNYTGLNPERRIWIRHIGITGHLSSPVLMNAIQRDTWDIIDTLLVALNPNDRRYGSHQHNVLPVARARGLGVIAMKAFADGVFYGRAPGFSRTASDVWLSVGRESGVSPADFVRYPLSLAGVSCLITGIGRIDRDNAENDQLVANLTAALGDVASPAEKRRIEDDVAAAHGTNTNYFAERRGLTQPARVEVEGDGERLVIRWSTALAGADPVRSYKLYAGDRLLASIPFRPQPTLAPLVAWVPASEVGSEGVRVEASTGL